MKMQSLVALALATLTLPIFSGQAFAQESCPVMENIYYSVDRVSDNLKETRFGQEPELLASQILAQAAQDEILAAMRAQNCQRPANNNPIPNILRGTYQGNCPVVHSALDHISAALLNFKNTRLVFRPALVHPESLLSQSSALLRAMGANKGCQ